MLPVSHFSSLSALAILCQKSHILRYVSAFIGFFIPATVLAAGLPANELSLWWCLPFIGVLLSIAVSPLLIPHLWHHHSGKIIAIWCCIFLLPLCWQFSIMTCVSLVLHTLLQEYLPFILLLLALYTLSGGIVIRNSGIGSVKLNVLLLASGTVLAGLMGTTGASMLLIRPILRANAQRRYRAHIVVFFIFLVANIGGGLTPLGDPPLFLGFLKGVGFKWTISNMILPVLLNTVLLLGVFTFIDQFLWLRETKTSTLPKPYNAKWRIEGKINLLFLLAVIVIILLSGLCKNYPIWQFFGIEISLIACIRDGLLLLITLCGLKYTPSALRQQNEFNWAPMQEVGKLFIGIFITIAPVMAILQLGSDGQFRQLVNFIHHNGAPVNTLYFWMSGVLSGFLDNAPTYLVFFNLAGGEAQLLMLQFPETLLAISMGSVFMGALSYIGNAPNLMIKSIAEQQHIAMPSFFGYMGWSLTILIPLFIVDTLLFF